MVRSYRVACTCTWRHFSACWAAIAGVARSYRVACTCTERHFSSCWAAIADMVRSYSWDAPTVKQRLQLSRIHSWDAPDGTLQYGQFGAGHAANSLHSALG